MSLLPVIACFCQLVLLPAGICRFECRALISLADIVELIVTSAHGCVERVDLRRAVDNFLSACEDCHWEQYMHPKFHWLVHIAMYAMLLACFVHERKHRMIKRYQNDVRNTIAFDKSVIAEVLCQQFAELSRASSFKLDVGVIGPRAAPKKLANFIREELDVPIGVAITTGAQGRVSRFEVCSRGDVVLFLSNDAVMIGELYLHAECAGEPISIISTWALLSECENSGTSKVRIKDDDTQVVNMSDILCSVIYKREADTALVIVPCLYRGKLR